MRLLGLTLSTQWRSLQTQLKDEHCLVGASAVQHDWIADAQAPIMHSSTTHVKHPGILLLAVLLVYTSTLHHAAGKSRQQVKKLHRNIRILYVVRLGKMSLNSKKLKTNFSFSLYSPVSELYHAKNPMTIEHTVPAI